MSLSKSAASPENLSQACPDTCGVLITSKDLHPVCLGLRHAEEALENHENCSHCLRMPKKLLQRRLKGVATQCVKLCNSDTAMTTCCWRPPRAQHLSTGLTRPIRLFPRGYLHGQPLVLQRTGQLMTMQAFSWSQRMRRSSCTLAFPRLTHPWPCPSPSSGLLAPPKPVFLNKRDHCSASVRQASYKYSASSVRCFHSPFHVPDRAFG